MERKAVSIFLRVTNFKRLNTDFGIEKEKKNQKIANREIGKRRISKKTKKDKRESRYQKAKVGNEIVAGG